jgi:tRNA1Val (adenine37-N6)-methyltransferase
MVLTKKGVFQFKQFEVAQDSSAMKVNSDGVLLGAWASCKGAESVLDIGTGTGVIALMAAQKNPTAKVIGIEIDQDSCKQAEANFKKSPWHGNLSVVSDPIQKFGKESEMKFDHIISNPPFFSGGTLSDNQPKNIVRHTVKLSHGDLLLAIRRLLSPEGRVSIILPVIEGLRFIEIVERYRFFISRKTLMRPRAGKPAERILFEFRQSEVKKSEDNEIVMYENEGKEYTAQYKELTGDFYL